MSRSRTYHWIGVALSVIGSVLVVLSLAQELLDVRVFSSSPLLVGTGVGAIGIALIAESRRGGRGADAEVRQGEA